MDRRGYALLNADNLVATVARMVVETTGNPAVGSSAPIKTILGSVIGWKYAVGDDLYFVFIHPPGLKIGGNMDCHLHFYSPNTTAARYVRFQVDYVVSKIGDVVNTGTASGSIDSGDILLETVGNKLSEKQMTSIVVPDINEADDPHWFFKISRIASAGTAPTAGDAPVMCHFEFEYDIDQFGYVN